jgi:hypothetical protein
MVIALEEFAHVRTCRLHVEDSSLEGNIKSMLILTMQAGSGRDLGSGLLQCNTGWAGLEQFAAQLGGRF